MVASIIHNSSDPLQACNILVSQWFTSSVIFSQYQRASELYLRHAISSDNISVVVVFFTLKSSTGDLGEMEPLLPGTAQMSPKRQQKLPFIVAQPKLHATPPSPTHPPVSPMSDTGISDEQIIQEQAPELIATRNTRKRKRRRVPLVGMPKKRKLMPYSAETSH